MKDRIRIELHPGRRVVVHYRSFEIATDQSVDSGGEGSAPEPFDLFLASLGACAGAYVSGFCRQRDIPTEGIRMSQSWEFDDLHRLQRVELTIGLPETFPEKYRAAVLRAAEQCSVKKALQRAPSIEARVEVTG